MPGKWLQAVHSARSKCNLPTKFTLIHITQSSFKKEGRSLNYETQFSDEDESHIKNKDTHLNEVSRIIGVHDLFSPQIGQQNTINLSFIDDSICHTGEKLEPNRVMQSLGVSARGGKTASKLDESVSLNADSGKQKVLNKSFTAKQHVPSQFASKNNIIRKSMSRILPSKQNFDKENRAANGNRFETCKKNKIGAREAVNMSWSCTKEFINSSQLNRSLQVVQPTQQKTEEEAICERDCDELSDAIPAESSDTCRLKLSDISMSIDCRRKTLVEKNKTAEDQNKSCEINNKEPKHPQKKQLQLEIDDSILS